MATISHARNTKITKADCTYIIIWWTYIIICNKFEVRLSRNHLKRKESAFHALLRTKSLNYEHEDFIGQKKKKHNPSIIIHLMLPISLTLIVTKYSSIKGEAIFTPTNQILQNHITGSLFVYANS